MERSRLAKAETKIPSPISPGPSQPSGGSADQRFFVSFGLIMSCRLGDVDRIRSLIEEAGGRVVFQTVSNAPLFLFRAAQVQRMIEGDLSALADIHRRKLKGG